MKHSFTVGAVSGISALALAFPMVAQIARAESQSTASTSSTAFWERPAFHERTLLSQDDVQAMIDADNAFLLHVDAFVAVQKEAIQNHRIALTAAADLTDETERRNAVQAAHAAMRTTLENAIASNPDLHTAMMPMGHHRKGGHRGPDQEKLAAKLGLTTAELKTKLASGKTIDDIADEEGVELPTRPAFRGGRRGSDQDDDNTVQD